MAAPSGKTSPAVGITMRPSVVRWGAIPSSILYFRQKSLHGKKKAERPDPRVRPPCSKFVGAIAELSFYLICVHSI